MGHQMMLSTEPINSGRSTWIRTREWRHQKPLPYRLAIDLQVTAFPDKSEGYLNHGAEGET